MATTNNITTNIVLNGINNLSGPLGKGIDRTGNKLDGLANKMRGISYGAFNVGRTFGAMAIGMAAPFVYAGKQALEFEDQMASIAKVAGVKFGTGEFKDMGKDVRDLSIYLGNTAVESGKLYESLAQAGIAKRDLKAIGKIAGETAIAFDIEAEAAGHAFGYIKSIMNLDVSKTQLAADAINALSNTRPATAARILTGLSSGAASVARSYGLAGKEIAAMVATLIVNGKSGEEAATVMERFALGIRKNASWTKIYNKEGKGMAGMLALINKGMASKDPAKFFDKMGMYGNDIKTLGLTMNDPNGLLGALALVADETKIAGSAHKEFTAQQLSTLSLLRREWARFNATMIDFGTVALPVIRDFVTELTPLVKGVGNWVEMNPRATKGILQLGAGLIAFSGIVSITSFAVGGIATAIRAFAATLGWIQSRKLVLSLVTGLSELNLITTASGVSLGALAGGVLLAGGAIAALGYLAYKTYEDLGYIPKGLLRIATGVKAFAKNVFPALNALIHGDIDKAMNISLKADIEADEDAKTIWALEPMTERPKMKDRRLRRQGITSMYGLQERSRDAKNGGKPITLEEKKEFRDLRERGINQGRGNNSDGLLQKSLQTDPLQKIKIPRIPGTPAAAEVPVLPGVPTTQAGKDSMTVNYSPTMNFNGNTSPEIKKAIEEATNLSRREFERTMKLVADDQKRRAIK